MAKSEAKDSSGEFYISHEKIYPRCVSGTFAWLRKTAVFFLLGMYYIFPWLEWEQRQAVLFDLPERKFYVFGFVFWPQDFMLLGGLLAIAAFTLFYFTSLAGRLWCGYACPQTVWSEVFLWMERITEGVRNKRIKLDKSPWTGEKILRKSAKQLLWISFAAWTGFTFVGFFTPINELGTKLLSFQLGGWETFWVIFYGFATYGNAGFLREQVCLYMCPYARFQSAMFDRDTLVISYDEERGEPRGSRKKGSDLADKGLGACIDCKQCVQVCPTGIDIRDGLQYECIACAACVDICDQVMEKMDYPKGLIKYTTQNAIDGKPSRIIRPRTIFYTILWTSSLLFFAVALFNRMPLIVDVLRDRKILYREISEQRIENIYTLRIINKDKQRHQYQVSLEGLKNATVTTLPETISIAAGDQKEIITKVRVPLGQLSRANHTIDFVVHAIDNESLQRIESSRFLTPLEKQ